MMKRIPRHSLPIQAWASVCAIALLCLVSAFSSGMLAWISETDAQAINNAGSIRMATYRINFQLATDFIELDPLDIDNDMSSNSPTTKLIASSAINHNSAALSRANPAHSAQIAILILDMESRLNKLEAYLTASKRQDKLINEDFNDIKSQWLQQLQPALVAENKQAFYANSLDYVADVNELVNELQYRNEQQQIWQQLIQIISLVLAFMIMLLGLYKLQQNVLIPVQKLIRANSQFKRGEYSTRVAIAGYTEFKKLGASFNQMAETIDTCQLSLENEIHIKTQHLVKANQALTLLYEFARHLTTSQLSVHKLDSLITDFGQILPHLELTLCLQNDVLNHKDSIALHSDNMQELCAKLTCDNCSIKNNEHTKSYLIAHQKTRFGELRVRPKSMLPTTPPYSQSQTQSSSQSQSPDLSTPSAAKISENSFQQSKQAAPQALRPQASNRIPIIDENSAYLQFENDELITTLTNLISTALSLRKQKQQEYQLVLFEERTTIARELHDSLAQSLSYLKIQISVLEKHLQKAFTQQESDAEQKVWAHIEHIKMGLKSAYQELRDLLVTFRLTIANDNFD